jgi:hypothetical protein
VKQTPGKKVGFLTAAQAATADAASGCLGSIAFTIIDVNVVNSDGSFGWSTPGPVGHSADFIRCMRALGYTFGATMPAYDRRAPAFTAPYFETGTQTP